MKNQHSITILLLFASIGLAPGISSATGQDQPFRNPTSFWIAGDLQVQKTPDGAGESRTFARIVRGPGLLMSPATVSYVKLPSKEKPQRPEAFIQSFGRVMGIPTWYHRTFKGAHAWDSYWRGNHRFIRIYYRTTARGAEYSVALFRPGFADRMMLETEVIQRQLLGLTDRRTAYLESAQEVITAFLMISEAHAGAFDVTQITGGGPVVDPIALGQLQSSLNSLNAQATTFNNNVAGVRTGVNDILGEARGFMGSVNTANSNWAQTNIEIARHRDALTAASNDATQSSIRLSNSMDRVSQRADDIRRTIEKSQSTGNVARVAFTAGLFGYLGTAVGTAGVSLVTSILRSLHVIPKDKAEQARAEAELRQGVARYNDLRTQTRDAEKSADDLIQSILKLKGMGYETAEDALKDINKRITKGAHVEKYADGLAQRLFEADIKGGSSPDGAALSTQYNELVDALSAIRAGNQTALDVRELLQRNNLNKLCATLSDTMAKLRKSESDLFLLGLDLAAQRESLQEVAQGESDRMHEEATELGSGRSIAATKKTTDERAQRDRDRITQQLTDESNALASSCVTNATKAYTDANPPSGNFFVRLFSSAPSPADKFGKGAVEKACSHFIEGTDIADAGLNSLIASSNRGLTSRIEAYRQHQADQATALAQIEAARAQVASAADRQQAQGEIRVSPLSVANRYAADAALTARLLQETTAEFQSNKLRELAKYESGATEACKFMGGKLSAVGEGLCKTSLGSVDPTCMLEAQTTEVAKKGQAAEARLTVLTAPPAPASAPEEQRSPAAVADLGF